MKITVKNKEQKIYYNQLRLVHTELKKWFKYKQYREDQKRSLEKIERKKKRLEKQHKQHLEKLESKEKNKRINKLLELLNVEYSKSDVKIDKKLILDLLTSNINFEYQEQLKLVHHELKLKIKSIRKKKSTSNSERNFNTMISTILNINEENNQLKNVFRILHSSK